MEVDEVKLEETPPANPNPNIITERNANIISGGNVFYNPVQEFNRDLSIAVLNVHFQRLAKERAEKLLKQQQRSKLKQQENGEQLTPTPTEATSPANNNYVAGTKYDDGMRILEALAATGLRSIRYAQEIAGVRQIIANDLSRQAVESINTNVRHNGVEHLIESSHADAMTLMYTSTAPEKRFDAVDLDPYGCPNRFLDGAMQCIADGGLLLVTATDMAVLAGNAPEACYVKYGSVPLRMKCCHEMALRILLHCIESHANRHGKYIEPLLSISADFYVRIFVRVYAGQAQCKYSMSKQSWIYQCTGCETFTLQPLGTVRAKSAEQPHLVKFGIPTGPAVNTLCEHCNHRHHLGGPIWSAPIHNMQFVEQLLEAVQTTPLKELGTQRRIVGVLSVVQEELPDIPLYYTPDKLCCVLKLEIVPMLKMRSALLHAGYRVSYSHASKNSLKTDAPPAVLWDLLRCWSKRHPVREDRKIPGTPLAAILAKPCSQDYEFDQLHSAANPSSRKNALSRFQENPAPHWGPGTRATIMIGENKLPKSYRNQNKKQRHKAAQQTTAAADEEASPPPKDELLSSKKAKLSPTTA
ncbi:tRNA (guanine(26)-N(2))-dimethyltransferase [Drosophila sulfurigaster albostrigata]|uniref:tRNA (guanine(26)-N(2))-dimethyltransferase n=1 Tax=Drosophila sulfurigaster albostrigata TaxID=89887 RepID=UPI002D2185A1|nr:tRNA (guanine(26)-N(2))-dimethyltransferase [Drosophila sulfurigaster albostrigata]XP_062142037.1 tRNA (guanine(26)-N(2))-dimethyltransferase [Drosophila sulfurigaster albostrigata]XP_062142038.1 tRNA (guanine(26)-N(2))-dimethyltransferase [Drosophila sulfurigaster albostrigata]XP_062142039.1 tRNA (guanine(26)-N(2))-dimethyltransferase [Drosophila sulfurigaster albostrigata]XP_062142040.1 tRNA (guanine(26)-N(2))-dimethyltransferase [Drosophila sulfurigaster albostrigata]XP_062142041.1 tRNA 